MQAAAQRLQPALVGQHAVNGLVSVYRQAEEEGETLDGQMVAELDDAVQAMEENDEEDEEGEGMEGDEYSEVPQEMAPYATPITSGSWGKSKHKWAYAFVRIKPGTGNYTVNGLPIHDYCQSVTSDRRKRITKIFDADKIEWYMMLPLWQIWGKDGMIPVDVEARTSHRYQGEAWYARAKAVRVALGIALGKADPEKKERMAELGFLERDRRMPERKKPGRRGARRAVQFSKR